MNFLHFAQFPVFAAAVWLAAPPSSSAQNQADEERARRVEFGSLICEVVPDSRRNFIIRSTASVECEFSGSDGKKEHYKGVTGIQLGIDLTVKEKEKLRFVVLSSRLKNEDVSPHALSGKYFGARAQASITTGVGVSILAGGGKNKFTLQPVNIETLRGLGIGAGLGYLYLEPKT